jgi:putative endonuclease
VSRKDADAKGRRGETLAAWYLRLKGWRILGQRVVTPHGEVDLIARRGRTVAFVEVKWRRNVLERDRALYPDLLRRVANAAESLSSRYVRPGDVIRIDAILIVRRKWPLHLVNVWQE